MAEYDIFIPNGFYFEMEDNEEDNKLYDALIDAFSNNPLSFLEGTFTLDRNGNLKFYYPPITFEADGNIYHVKFEGAESFLNFVEDIGWTVHTGEDKPTKFGVVKR